MGSARLSRLLGLVAAAAAQLSVGVPAEAAPPAPSPEQSCTAFRPGELGEGAEIRSVTFAPAAAGSPARCKVTGAITTSPRSTINFQVDLPAAPQWNGKLLFLGGGGFDGYVPTSVPGTIERYERNFLGPDAASSRTFIMVSNDSGHQGRGKNPILDFSWAAGNPDAVTNHAARANHRVLWVAVALGKAFYGRAPSHRYMLGMSNGGRQGLMAAQAFPEDYQGIVAFAPAIAQEGFAANHAEVLSHIYARPENWLDEKGRELLVKSQVAACDKLDGLEDGIIGNYRACRFDPATLLCPDEAADPGRCLSAGQVEGLRRLFADRKANVLLADGYIGYPGYGAGSDLNEWNYIYGSTFAARDAVNFTLADNIVKVITNDPNASIMTHDPEQWAPQYLALSEQIDATNPDLRAFHAAGGKILIFYGAGDLNVSINRLGDYVDAVDGKVGRDTRRSFLRFYPLPSQGHSWTGDGINYVGALSAVQNWAERGAAPDRLVGTHRDASGVDRFARPLCEAGSYARYAGKGDPAKSTSFTCVKE